MIKILVKKGLAKFGFQIHRIQSMPKSNLIPVWDECEQFNDIWRKVNGFTLVDKIRCFMIYQFARQVSKLTGDVAEVGVYKGGTAKLMAKTFELSDKTVHLFDTFSGMPPTDPERDWVKEGDFGDTSLESVKYYLRDCENVLIYSGLFPGSAKNLKDKTFCLVHVDADIYKSVVDCCNFFYPKMVSGGIIIFDDYGFTTCPGAKIAVDEFFPHKPESICYLPTGQCFIIKQ